jgi:hypothetical protein
MAKKISSKDLFEQEDIFKGIRDSAEKTLVSLNKINDEFKQTATTLKQSLGDAKFDSSESIKKFTAATAEANKIQKQSIEIQKLQEQVKQQAIKSEKEQERLQQERIKTQKAESQEKSRLTAESAKAVKASENEKSAYSKLSTELNNARKAYKDLAVTNQSNTVEAKTLLDTITRLDTQLKKVDATVGQHQRSVGDYTGALASLDQKLAEGNLGVREMNQLMKEYQSIALKAGETSPVGKKAIDNASALQDRLGDLKNRTKLLSSDTVKLDTALAGIGVGASAFQGVQGAMALMGGESKQLQEAMVKLQAVQMVSNSINQIALALNKDSILGLQLRNGIEKLRALFLGQSTAATVVNTVATEAQGGAIVATTVATTAATRATKLLRMALITSGIGAIVVLLGVAAEAMGLFEDKTAEEEKAQKLLERQTKSLEKTIESYGRATDALTQIVDNSTRSELALARQRGASQKELTAITKAGAQDRLRILQTETDGLRSIYLQQSKTGSTENFAKAEKAYLESVQKTKDAQIKIQEIDADIAEAGRENVQNFAGTAVEITDLHDQIVDEQIKLIQDDDQRAQTQLIVESERRKRDVKNTVADKKQKATLIKAIEENLILELDKLDNEWYEKSLQAQKEADAAKLQAKLDFENKIEKITEENTLRNMSDKDKEVRAVNDKYFTLEQQAKGNKEALEQIDIAKRNELNDINLKYDDIEYKNKKEKADKEKELELKSQEERRKTIEAFANKTAEYFKKKSDEKIKAIDAEMAAAQKQSDALKELAANGNINAQQSLAENQRIIDQANLRKEKELKKQQRIEAGLAIFKLFSANADKKNPLAATIKDTTGLLAFISSLPMFYDGTEDTGSNGQGIDGKGGFHAVLHPNERVLPKSLNEQIGSMSNEQLTKIAQEYQNGRLVSKSNANSSLELAVLASKLDTLTDVIKNKPETNIALGEITQSAMQIVESKRTGNTTIYNRFRVSK